MKPRFIRIWGTWCLATKDGLIYPLANDVRYLQSAMTMFGLDARGSIR